MRVIRLTHDLCLTRSHALCGAVAGLWRVVVALAVNLNQLREVDVLAESILYGADIRLVAVCGHLDTARHPSGQIVHEVVSGLGIPVADVDALKSYWAVCPRLRKTLFKPNRPGYVDLAVQKTAIKPAIYEHPEFTAFIAGMNAHFAEWREASATTLKALKVGCHPKQVIVELAEGLLAHYDNKPLIDPYDIYQHLMDYWAESMQDDCYQIAADGWKAETSRIIETKKSKDGKVIKKIDKGWTCDLVPKALLVARYYAKEQAEIDKLSADLESVTAKLAELEEEQLGDEDAFSEARADAEEGKVGKVTRATVTARLKQIKDDKDAKDEAVVLNAWIALNDDEADLKKQLISFDEVMIRPSPPDTSHRNVPIFTAASAGIGAARAGRTAAAIAIVRLRIPI